MAQERGLPLGFIDFSAAESTREWLKENGCPQHYDESDEYSDDDYSDDDYSDDEYSDDDYSDEDE